MVSRLEILGLLNENPTWSLAECARHVNTSRQNIQKVYADWKLANNIATLVKVVIREASGDNIQNAEYDKLDQLLDFCKKQGVKVE